MGSPSGKVEELRELVNDLLVPAFLEAFADAAVQMAAQEQPFELVDGALDGVGLLEDVHAVLVFLNHPANPLEMAFDVRETLQDVRLFCLHGARSRKPPPRGCGLSVR